jgi:hypothetical protein
MMEPEKEAHLKSMQDKFLAQSRQKYEAGQIEHGGRMWEKPGMLANAKEEVIDLWHYLCTLEDQIANVHKKYDELSTDDSLQDQGKE